MEQGRALRDFFTSSLQSIGVAVSQEQIDGYLLFLDQLLKWNQVTNLTSIEDPHEIVSKHFVDSLTALQAISFPQRARLIDVGSGAGFPGLPLKIARQDLQLTLIEPVQKKCSFLQSIIGSLKLTGVTVFNGNIAQYVRQANHHLCDVVTVRALRFDEIEPQVFEVLKSDGKAVLYRTEEIGNTNHFKMFDLLSEKAFVLPMGHGHRVISVMTKREGVRRSS